MGDPAGLTCLPLQRTVTDTPVQFDRIGQVHVSVQPLLKVGRYAREGMHSMNKKDLEGLQAHEQEERGDQIMNHSAY